ncbi:MAG: hypothetical protein IKF38_05680 [Clostridia bacterium]|nr:hypothetical protein [Clostridia bacterium]
MKNKQYRNHRDQLKKRKSLSQLAAEGKKEVIWSLKPEDVLNLAQFYKITPYLYSMRTRKFSNIRYIKSPLLKELHYQHKRGKEFITRKLNKEELHLLQDHGITCKIIKYRIVLN